MDSSSFQKRFAFATNLIQEAGEIALGYFRRLDTLVVKSKGHQDMASQADLDKTRRSSFETASKVNFQRMHF